MALIQDEIDYVVNPALDRIHAGIITLANSTTKEEGKSADRNYSRTRNSLLRSFEWPWASTRAELSIINTLTLDRMPTAAWSVADTITGITSGTTAEILKVNSGSSYVVIRQSGDFTSGETITNATVETVYYDGVEVTYEGETVYSYDSSAAYQINCATGYPTAVALAPSHKWTYQYYLPDDFVRIRNVYEEDDIDAVDYRWTREGKRILTDYDSVNIKYVQSITDPTEFDELFLEVFILRLALKLLPILAGTASRSFREDLRAELQETEARARVISFQEDNTTGRDHFNNARYSS